MADRSSTTSQSGKLGIKPGMRINLDRAPAGWRLSDSSTEMVGPRSSADIIISFFKSAHELERRLPNLAKRIHSAGALWVAWPRRAGGHTSDITDNVVREFALPLGNVDVKVAAIDSDWSGLRFVWRR